MPTIYGKSYSLALPSGNKVRVRRVSLLTMVRSKQLPSALIAAVWNTFGTADKVDIKESDRVIAMVDMMDACIKAILLDLKVTEDGVSETHVDTDGYTVGVVNLADVPDRDKNVLFAFAQSVVDGVEVEQDLQKFRPEPASQTAGPSGEAVRAPAESADRAPAQEAGAGV